MRGEAGLEPPEEAAPLHDSARNKLATGQSECVVVRYPPGRFRAQTFHVRYVALCCDKS